MKIWEKGVKNMARCGCCDSKPKIKKKTTPKTSAKKKTSKKKK
ncbi:MAG: hypothetical protein ABIH29_01700 [Candidatus Micrarchaeota archaeon]